MKKKSILHQWQEIEKLNQALGTDLEAYEFLKLAKKFAYHDPYKCDEERCMVCEAIGTIENVQSQIAANEQDRQWSHMLENGDVF